MTTHTETYIELSDIIGVRLLCKSCGCSLRMEIEKDGGTLDSLLSNANVVLIKCPTCGHAWTSGNPGQPFDSDVKEFFRKMRDLKKIEASFGCKLALEIKGVSPSGHALSAKD
jgi:hypothetical protein